jgi:hypothetical protein
MAVSFIQSVLYFQPKLTRAEGMKAILRAFEGFGVYQGGGLVPLFPDDVSALASGDEERFSSMGECLEVEHVSMGTATGSDLWTLSFDWIDYDDEPGGSEIHINPLLPEASKDAVLAVWKFMDSALRGFVLATKPSLAMANGLDEREGMGDLPTVGQIKPGEWPPFLAPWTYLGPDRLTADKRRFLSQLPVHETGELDEGWLLRPVSDLLAEPDPRFLAALAGPANGRILGYRQTPF